MSPIAMTLLLVGSLSFFVWSAARRIRQLLVGSPVSDFDLSPREILRRLGGVIDYAFLQRKMRDPGSRYRVAGWAHILIFAGFNVLLIRTLVLWSRGYDPFFDFWGLLSHDAWIGRVYGLLKDVFAVLVLLGAVTFVYLRLRKTSRMTLGFEGLLILGIIITMMVSDIVYDGAWFVLQADLHGERFSVRPWEPVGSTLALIFDRTGVSHEKLRFLAHAGFWTHSALVLVFLNILPFSKHFHILTVLPNVFAAPSSPAGALPPVSDLEGRVERDEPVGLRSVRDLTWKHILDLYTCTECGRCSDNCPAYMTGKKLSPKHLTLALRDHLYDTEKAMFSEGGVAAGTVDSSGDEIHTHPAPPEGAYFRSSTEVDLVPHILHPDVLWACTSCRACEEQCPVLISYVDKIVGMRRDLVMMKAEFPADLQRPFAGMETNGNPWNLSAMDRVKWADGLEAPTISENPDAEVVYWVGCAASYDDRAKKVARATTQLLQEAKVNFAIVGQQESCTGDPARRAGNEYLFQILAEQNVETLNAAGCQEKKVITACPHCFNTLSNEYPEFGGVYEVVHHSDFLLGLLTEGKLRATRSVEGRIAYHDSCYLGRYNDVYDPPRKLLQAIPGVELVEVPTWNREKGLCCGAGGAQMWMEEKGETRVNQKRTLQLLETKPSTIASGCPFCMTMLSDGLKAEDNEAVAQMDVAELLARSVGVPEFAVA